MVAEKPTRASEYSSEQAELVRATCLYVATKLGDLMDELVVVGGLVPSLLVDPTGLPEGTPAHVGTLDLDVGLKLALLPGLKLAFQDRRRVRIDGKTIFGENASREVWVCGPRAFVVLKALAFKGRGENKDAYDLYYLVRNFGEVETLRRSPCPMSDNSSLRQAIAEEEVRLAWLEKERARALAKLQELKDRLAVEESAPTSPMPVPSDEAPSRSGYLPQSRQPNSPASNRHRQPRSGGAYSPGDSSPSGWLTSSESIRAASEVPFEVDLVEKSPWPRGAKDPRRK